MLRLACCDRLGTARSNNLVTFVLPRVGIRNIHAHAKCVQASIRIPGCVISEHYSASRFRYTLNVRAAVLERVFQHRCWKEVNDGRSTEETSAVQS